MKFLTITTPKDMTSSPSPATSRQLLEATVAWVSAQKQTGTLLEIYAIPGWNRNIVICEHESGEELAHMLNEVPLAAFLSFEVYPLADWDEYMKGLIAGAGS